MQHRKNAETLDAVKRERESYSLYTTKKLFMQKMLSTNQTKSNSTYTELNSQIGFICVAQNTINKIGYVLETKKLELSF